MKKSTQASLPGISEPPAVTKFPSVTLTKLRLVAVKIQTDTGRLTATLEGTVSHSPTAEGGEVLPDLARLEESVWATALMAWAQQILAKEVEWTREEP